MSQPSPVTKRLQQNADGNPQALNDVVPLVYDTLRRLAHRALRQERDGHTLNTTALAHEAYLELLGLQRIEWKNRSQFFAIAATAIRRVLVDYAVARNALKRGGKQPHVALSLCEGQIGGADANLDDLLALNDALQRLESASPRAVRVVECRVLMGMTIDETAGALDLSAATVKRQWNLARAWLTRELSGAEPAGPLNDETQ
jgi:RNA polymerase sigma factor (TIGR02999 family)